jgi:hypothetical protein
VEAEKTKRLLRLGVVLTSLYILLRDWRNKPR